MQQTQPMSPIVDAELLAIPNSAFTAVEPSEFGVFGAPTVREAIQPLLTGDNAALNVTEGVDGATVDVVHGNQENGVPSAQHVRIEFRREPDGWYPTNAYRRQQCTRGGGEGAAAPCP